ncbi:MAG: MerR family transcriptional regulator [Pseudomonadota bacterium]
MEKAPDAFRTISEVSDWLDTPTHVLRFWESRFPEVAPVKRAGGRRYYRVEDVLLLGGIKKLLHEDGVTIKALQDRIKSDGAESVAQLSPPLDGLHQGASDSPDSEASKTGPAPGDTPVPARAPSTATKSTGGPAPAEEGASARPQSGRTRPPLGGRQRSLSFGDAPAPETAAASNASFKRHPGRVRRDSAPKPEPDKSTARAHPSRPGLFLYDDSELPSADAPPPATPQEQPALAPIDHVPEDIGDDCQSPNGLPPTAELRALAVLVASPLPDDAADLLSRLRALSDRWE